jgi:hypothetical protein
MQVVNVEVEKKIYKAGVEDGGQALWLAQVIHRRAGRIVKASYTRQVWHARDQSPAFLSRPLRDAITLAEWSAAEKRAATH